ncbi:hypothetical protein HDU96_002897 [Phlyctochytrium bullatum]|nr:hypothetical protein HDU96_002897 [Phlyctochytrium bullatum]
MQLTAILAVAAIAASSFTPAVNAQSASGCQNVLCPAVIDEVCGSNGVTYANSCELEKAKNCSGPSTLAIAYRGKCEEGVTALPSVSSPTPLTTPAPSTTTTLECPSFCPDIFDPVCASNGIQYPNSCQLEIEICKNPGIRLLSVGPCAEGSVTIASGSASTGLPATVSARTTAASSSSAAPVSSLTTQPAAASSVTAVTPTSTTSSRSGAAGVVDKGVLSVAGLAAGVVSVVAAFLF